MMTLDFFLYGLLALWLDNIVPTDYGIKRVPWFFLMPSYWKSSDKKENSKVEPMDASPDIEPPDESLIGEEAVQLRHMKKE